MSGETPTEQARRIANHLLTLLPEPTRTQLVTQARAAGITWLGPTPVVYDDDEVLPPGEAAALVHRRPGDLRQWVAMGVLVRQGGGGYRVRDVYAAQAAIRARRTHRRHHPPMNDTGGAATGLPTESPPFETP